VTDLPENLKGFEELFRPDGYVSPAKSAADTLILERPLPPEAFTTRVRHIGRSVLRNIWRSPRTRRYGLGLGLGSAAIATGITVAFLTSQTEATQAQPSETLILKPNNSAHPPKKSQTLPRMAPVANPSDISTMIPYWSPTPSNQTEHVTPSKSALASASASPKTPRPVAPTPSWSTRYPTRPVEPESPTALPTDTPPSDTPTFPLETSSQSTSQSTSEQPETPPTSLSPSRGD